jgi:hypothetical protein
MEYLTRPPRFLPIAKCSCITLSSHGMARAASARGWTIRMKKYTRSARADGHRASCITE